MSYSRSFRETLQSKNPDISVRLIEIEKIAKSLLTYTAAKFPHYTPHDFQHSERCEEILCWLTPDELRESMNANELFFAILACWFHDWGLIGYENENPEAIREDHQRRTEKHFEIMYEKIRLSRNEARIIGRICKGHRKEDLTSPEFDDVFFGSNIPVRVRLLSALVRLADECEVEASRVPEVIYYSINPSKKAKIEFERHLDTIGIGLAANHKLRIHGVGRDPKGALTLRMLRDKIQKELDIIKGILYQYGIPLDQVELKLDARGFIDKPISFSLDEKKVTQLLIGEHLYSRKDVPIRELLQNAIDSCKLRKELEKNYEPKIELVFSGNELDISDNGFGMDFETALSFLARKGHSFYGSEEFKTLGVKFEPISRFGLGVLSCFLIAKKIIINTKQSRKESCEFTINGVDEGWTYRRGTKKTSGTTVKLFLTEEGKKLDMMEALRHYVKIIEIPICISINGKDEKIVPDWNIEMREVTEYLEREGRFGETSLNEILRESNDEIDFVIYKNESVNYIGEQLFLSIHGIFVGDFDLTLFCPLRFSNSITLLNVKKNILDIDLSRDKIVKNTKLKLFRSMLTKIITEKISKKLSNAKRESPPVLFYSEFTKTIRRDLGISLQCSIDDVKGISCFTEDFVFHPVFDGKNVQFVLLKDIIDVRRN